MGRSNEARRAGGWPERPVGIIALTKIGAIGGVEPGRAQTPLANRRSCEGYMGVVGTPSCPGDRTRGPGVLGFFEGQPWSVVSSTASWPSRIGS